MNSVYNKCRDIISKYIDCDDDIKEVLCMAFMGLVSYFGESFIEEIPKMLGDLTVERVKGDNVVLNIDAVFDDDETVADKVLYYPEDSFEDNYTEVIIRTIFELIHLYRFNGITEKNGSIELKTGVASKKITIDDFSVKERGFELEEAITSYFAKEAFNGLRLLLEDDECDISMEHYEDIINHKYYLYDIRTHIMELFMKNDDFKKIVTSHSEEDNKPFSIKYNDFMDNDAAFSKLLKLYQNLSKYLNDEDEDNLNDTIKALLSEIDSFNNKGKQYKKD